MGEGPEAGVVKVADFGLARFFQVCRNTDPQGHYGVWFGGVLCVHPSVCVLAAVVEASVVKVADVGVARFFQVCAAHEHFD